MSTFAVQTFPSFGDTSPVSDTGALLSSMIVAVSDAKMLCAVFNSPAHKATTTGFSLYSSFIVGSVSAPSPASLFAFPARLVLDHVTSMPPMSFAGGAIFVSSASDDRCGTIALAPLLDYFIVDADGDESISIVEDRP